MVLEMLSSVTCEARDDMDVDVRDLLTGCRVIVDDDVGAVITQDRTLLGLDLFGHKNQMGQNLIRAACHVGVGLSGNHEAVAFLDRIDVHDDKAKLVLIDLGARDDSDRFS